MNIIEVRYITDFVLVCRFDDGKIVTANFRKFLMHSQNPMTKQFLDKERFAKVEIRNGHLTWEDGQMDIPRWSVYNGEF